MVLQGRLCGETNLLLCLKTMRPGYSANMSMRGNCRCRNIEVRWQITDYSLVPRACPCIYCQQKSAAYVSKSGSRFAVVIHNDALHKTRQNGSHQARFHECANCGDVVFVTAEIEGETFGALNAGCLHNRCGFPAPLPIDNTAQTAQERLARWHQHWCRVV